MKCSSEAAVLAATPAERCGIDELLPGDRYGSSDPVGHVEECASIAEAFGSFPTELLQVSSQPRLSSYTLEKCRRANHEYYTCHHTSS